MLGLLREGESVAAQILRSRGVTLERFRVRLLEIVGGGADDVPPKLHSPFTPRARKVLELAFREALALDTNSVGAEHLLLGIARENASVTMRILHEEWGLHSEVIRSAVVESNGRFPAARGARKERSIGKLSLDYDKALEIIVGWNGRNVVVRCSFDMPSIGFEKREFTGRLREGRVPPAPGARVLTARAHMHGELQPASEDGRHFSVWGTDPCAEAQERAILQFALFRETFSESAWLEPNRSENGLMIRHGSFRWVIRPQR